MSGAMRKQKRRERKRKGREGKALKMNGKYVKVNHVIRKLIRKLYNEKNLSGAKFDDAS